MKQFLQSVRTGEARGTEVGRSQVLVRVIA